MWFDWAGLVTRSTRVGDDLAAGLHAPTDGREMHRLTEHLLTCALTEQAPQHSPSGRTASPSRHSYPPPANDLAASSVTVSRHCNECAQDAGAGGWWWWWGGKPATAKNERLAAEYPPPPSPLIASLRIMSYKVDWGYEPPLKGMTIYFADTEAIDTRVEGPSWVRSSPGVDEEDLRLMPALDGRLLCDICDMVCDMRTWRMPGGPPPSPRRPRAIHLCTIRHEDGWPCRKDTMHGVLLCLHGLQPLHLTQPVDGPASRPAAAPGATGAP